MNATEGAERRTVPVACTLGPSDGVERTRRWQRLHERAAPEARLQPGHLEVRYRAVPGVADELAALAAAEQDCCSFVTWSVVDLDGGPALRVDAPGNRPEAVLPIAALFGIAVPSPPVKA